MNMDASLASELTTDERCEYLLTVIASAMTRKHPSEVAPWLKKKQGVFRGR
jgi:hypothetical protein